MKLIKKYFDELPESSKNQVIEDFSDEYNVDYLLNDKYSRSIVNAEVAIDEDGNVYDVRVFDPYHNIPSNGKLPVYIGPFGWSYWLFGYTDLAGYDVDEIFFEHDGELQI